MAYRAIKEIGGFKKGDIVPDEQAEVWASMYAESPVEKVQDAPKQAPLAPVAPTEHKSAGAKGRLKR